MTTFILFLTIWSFVVLIANEESNYPFTIIVEEEDEEELYTTSPDNGIEFCEYVKCDPLIFDSLRVLPVLVSEDVEDEEESK